MWCRDQGTSMDNSLSCRNMEGEEGEFSYHLKGYLQEGMVGLLGSDGSG